MLRTCILASSLHFYVCFLDANTALPYASTPTLRVKASLLHSFQYPHSKKSLLHFYAKGLFLFIFVQHLQKTHFKSLYIAIFFVTKGKMKKYSFLCLTNTVQITIIFNIYKDVEGNKIHNYSA